MDKFSRINQTRFQLYYRVWGGIISCSYGGNTNRMLAECPNRFDEIRINGELADYTPSWDDWEEWGRRNCTCGGCWGRGHEYYYWIRLDLKLEEVIRNVSVQVYNCREVPIDSVFCDYTLLQN